MLSSSAWQDLSLSVVNTSTHPPTTDTERLSWATSMFYFGMLAGLYTITFMLQRFNLGRILGAVVIVQALVRMLTVTVTSWRGLCPALLPRLCGIDHPNRLHMYYQRLLHAKMGRLSVNPGGSPPPAYSPSLEARWITGLPRL